MQISEKRKEMIKTEIDIWVYRSQERSLLSEIHFEFNPDSNLTQIKQILKLVD